MSRNEIFNDLPPVEGNMPSQTRADVQKELGFDIPVETVPLPSLGKAYPPSHPLHLQETVSIRAMTAREEDILTSRALIKNGSVVSTLINSCLINKDIDATTLLSGDRNAILTAIRITGYGADYNTEITCPACFAKQKKSYSLTDLPIRALEVDPVSPGENAFSHVLPVSGKTVTLRFATGHDEEEAAVTNERKKKHGLQIDNLVTDRLFRSVVSIDGTQDKSKIRQFVSNMPARDSWSIRNFLDNNEPGLDQRVDFNCDVCDHDEEMPLPLGANFFWPGT